MKDGKWQRKPCNKQILDVIQDAETERGCLVSPPRSVSVCVCVCVFCACQFVHAFVHICTRLLKGICVCMYVCLYCICIYLPQVILSTLQNNFLLFNAYIVFFFFFNTAVILLYCLHLHTMEDFYSKTSSTFSTAKCPFSQLHLIMSTRKCF